MDRKQQHKFSSKKDEKKLQRREVNVQVSYTLRIFIFFILYMGPVSNKTFLAS